jgi:hypothetical protein
MFRLLHTFFELLAPSVSIIPYTLHGHLAMVFATVLNSGKHVINFCTENFVVVN